jgi:type IV pilus assembly protein PilQ
MNQLTHLTLMSAALPARRARLRGMWLGRLLNPGARGMSRVRPPVQSRVLTRALTLFLTLALPGLCLAQGQPADNTISAISAVQYGASLIVKVTMDKPPEKAPVGFAISNPARIALDFSSTANGTGKNVQDINMGDLRSVGIVQAGERSRLVLNLKRPVNYATAIDGRNVLITLDGSGGSATALTAAGVPAAPAPASSAVTEAMGERGRQQIRDIEFRHGAGGEGRIVIELPSKQVLVDARQQGQNIVVDFMRIGLPPSLRRRLDVSQFGTPVKLITTTAKGDNVRMVIEPRGMWEHSTYQSDTQLVIEVKPIKEVANKLGGGVQAYRGDKVTFNFQNIEVRAILQVLADFTGLNIITSDSVSGNMTLHLKDVPWDQALDVVMQYRGLDMRKNGSVLLIAPKDELLTKEKLELEQRAQIAELEPLRTEVFQLNYQKAESFKTVFGLDGGGTSGTGASSSVDSKNRILSKRGSATSDPRTNKLFVTDIASKLEEVRKLIQMTDVASRQVMIEARIVEAADTFSRSLGAKLGFSASSGVTTASTATSQFVNLPASSINGVSTGSLAVSLFSASANRFVNLELSALEADGKGKIISSPRIVTANQSTGLIESGEEIPYQNATSSGATAVEFKKANLRLQVTPQITPDGNIILDVDVNKDSRGTATTSGLAINTKHAKTTVQVENGGTVVLGGIYTQTEQNDESKIPFFGDLPVLGYLFKTTTVTNDKTELLIFITPKIIAEKAALD